MYPPPQENEIGLNMNAIEKDHLKWGHQVHFTIYPPLPGPYLILCMHRKIVHFNFKWIFENLNFWFSDDKDIRVRWWNRKKGPLSHWKMKCSFLDYVQFLMIGWAIQVMNINQNAKKDPHVIKKLNAQFWITFNFWWSAEWFERWKLTEMWKKAPCVIKK